MQNAYPAAGKLCHQLSQEDLPILQNFSQNPVPSYFAPTVSNKAIRATDTPTPFEFAK